MDVFRENKIIIKPDGEDEEKDKIKLQILSTKLEKT